MILCVARNSKKLKRILIIKKQHVSTINNEKMTFISGGIPVHIQVILAK